AMDPIVRLPGDGGGAAGARASSSRGAGSGEPLVRSEGEGPVARGAARRNTGSGPGKASSLIWIRRRKGGAGTWGANGNRLGGEGAPTPPLSQRPRAASAPNSPVAKL